MSYLITWVFWRYVLVGPEDRRSRSRDGNSLSAMWCRFKGHPNGIVYYAGPTATEPDTRCVDCDEDLG